MVSAHRSGIDVKLHTRRHALAGTEGTVRQIGTACSAMVTNADEPQSRTAPPSPFRYFNSSPEVIRLVVMMYVKYPLSLRNVEDLLAERGIDV